MEKVHIRSVSRLARGGLKLCHWESTPHLSTPEDTRRHSRSRREEHLHSLLPEQEEVVGSQALHATWAGQDLSQVPERHQNTAVRL